MAIIEEIIGGEMLAGAGLGAGIVLVLGRVVRPAAKALIRGGIVVYREAADMLSEAAAHPAAISLRAAAPRKQARRSGKANKPQRMAKSGKEAPGRRRRRKGASRVRRRSR